MKNGRCPACGSAAVYSKPNGIGWAQQTSVFVYGAGSQMAKASSTRAYVCASCGRFEVYMIDTSVIAEIAKTWPKVPVQ
jgi:hypothetical protein